MFPGAQGRRSKRLALLFSSAVILTGSLLAGCASRTVATEEPAPLAAAPPRAPSYDNRSPSPPAEPQGIGAKKIWMDDPALRRGPQGQPAPYGRDTVTGRPLGELPPSGQPPQPGYAPLARPVPGNSVVVGRGDTLFAIARRHNVSVDALIRANNLSSDRIREGQTLVIPPR